MAVTIAADRGDHRPTDRAIARRAKERTRPGGFRDRVSRADHLDERAALDAADQGRATPRQRAFLVGHAGIQVARRSAELCGGPDRASGPPVVDPAARELAGDGEKHAAACGRPALSGSASDGDPERSGLRTGSIDIDVQAQRHAGRSLHRVRPQDAGHDRRPRLPSLRLPRSSSKAIRSGGRHASRHASADSSAPPPAKAMATAAIRMDRPVRPERPQRQPGADRQQLRRRANYVEGARPAADPARRPMAGIAATCRTATTGATRPPQGGRRGSRGRRGAESQRLRGSALALSARLSASAPLRPLPSLRPRRRG